MAAAPAAQELHAAPGWRTIEFISDLHLHAGEPATFAAWRTYMAGAQASAMFILGDLFEAWVGDDAALEPGFAADCAAVLQSTARRLPVFFLHGNRDFLVGDGLLGAAGVTLLQDPTVLGFGGRRWLLSHGDLLCLADTDYLAFRATVREPAWQRAFLARPLAERRRIAQDLRARSDALKREDGVCADVDTQAAIAWLQAADAAVLIHGHTHRPGETVLGPGRRRIVLSDWDAAADPPRLEVLRIDLQGGVQRVALA